MKKDDKNMTEYRLLRDLDMAKLFLSYAYENAKQLDNEFADELKDCENTIETLLKACEDKFEIKRERTKVKSAKNRNKRRKRKQQSIKR